MARGYSSGSDSSSEPEEQATEAVANQDSDESDESSTDGHERAGRIDTVRMLSGSRSRIGSVFGAPTLTTSTSFSDDDSSVVASVAAAKSEIQKKDDKTRDGTPTHSEDSSQPGQDGASSPSVSSPLKRQFNSSAQLPKKGVPLSDKRRISRIESGIAIIDRLDSLLDTLGDIASGVDSSSASHESLPTGETDFRRQPSRFAEDSADEFTVSVDSLSKSEVGSTDEDNVSDESDIESDKSRLRGADSHQISKNEHARKPAKSVKREADSHQTSKTSKSATLLSRQTSSPSTTVLTREDGVIMMLPHQKPEKQKEAATEKLRVVQTKSVLLRIESPRMTTTTRQSLDLTVESLRDKLRLKTPGETERFELWHQERKLPLRARLVDCELKAGADVLYFQPTRPPFISDADVNLWHPAKPLPTTVSDSIKRLFREVRIGKTFAYRPDNRRIIHNIIKAHYAFQTLQEDETVEFVNALSPKKSQVDPSSPVAVRHIRYSKLRRPDKRPATVDSMKLEKYLSDDDFLRVMRMDREEFRILPLWRQWVIKIQVGLAA